jgi:hypothetical protein
MTKFYLPDMTSVEAAQAIKERKVVVLPVGAIHKHGDGVVGTDMYSCTELSKRFGEAVPDRVIVLPTLPYGVSGGSVLPGGVDTSQALVQQMIKEICMSFVKYGTKHFLFITGHGGNNSAYLNVAREMTKYGVLSAYVRWWDLILQLKGEEITNYQNVNILEQSVAAACGKVDPSVLRDGETRLGAFGQRLRSEVFGDTFTYPEKMKGTWLCSGRYPMITRLPNAVIYEGGTIQMPLPRAPIDLDDPEPGDWPSIADKVSVEAGNDILDTCVAWLVKFLDDFEKLEIPEKYWKK